MTSQEIPTEARAAVAGRSMEAEARAILATACADPNGEDAVLSPEELQEWVDQLYAPDKPSKVVEALIAERREEAARE